MNDTWDPTTVATFDDAMLADLAKSRLESEGIRAIIPDQHFNAVYGGILQPALGGIRLQVDKSDALRAHTVLSAIDPSYRANEHCPQCSKDTLRLSPRSRRLLNFLLFLFTNRVPAKQSYWRCSSCGYTSK